LMAASFSKPICGFFGRSSWVVPIPHISCHPTVSDLAMGSGFDWNMVPASSGPASCSLSKQRFGSILHFRPTHMYMVYGHPTINRNSF
jgi:hypothetical protein